MRALFLVVSTLFICQQLLAQPVFPQSSQNNTAPLKENGIPILSDLNVNQDPRVEKMLRWHISNNKKRDGMEGFRVEIFSSSALDAKDKAFREKVEFLKLYPNYNVHVKFIAPVFKVRIGDFRTKNKAMKLHKKIQKDYPGAFIVPDIIDFPLLKPEKNERSD